MVGDSGAELKVFSEQDGGRVENEDAAAGRRRGRRWDRLRWMQMIHCEQQREGRPRCVALIGSCKKQI